MQNTPRYRILDPIGRGRIGEIFLAESLDPEVKPRQVAVALMDPRITEHEASFQALQEQVDILEQLEHPNIARTIELSWFLEGWGLVMEYARGLDLELYRIAGAIPIRVIIEIADQVCSALRVALELPLPGRDVPLELVHGDLVPSLVRIDDKGSVKVCAFGLAAPEGPDPAFSAPEQRLGQSSPAGDVYSLGLILARLATGLDFRSPPADEAEHRAFVTSIIDAVSQQVRGDVAEAHHRSLEPVLLMLESMLDFHPRRRPDAARVSMGCRSMLGVLPGPWLDSWAKTKVPEYYERSRDFARMRDPAAVVMPASAATRVEAPTPEPASPHPFFMDGLFDEAEEEDPPLIGAAAVALTAEDQEPDEDDEGPTGDQLEEEASSADVEDDEEPTGDQLEEEASSADVEDDEGPTGDQLEEEEPPEPSEEPVEEEPSEEPVQEEPSEEPVEEEPSEEPVQEEPSEEPVEEEPSEEPVQEAIAPSPYAFEDEELSEDNLDDEEPSEELARFGAAAVVMPAAAPPAEESAEEEPVEEEPVEEEPERESVLTPLGADALEELADDDIEDVSEHLIDEEAGALAPVVPEEVPPVPKPVPAPALGTKPAPKKSSPIPWWAAIFAVVLILTVVALYMNGLLGGTEPELEPEAPPPVPSAVEPGPAPPPSVPPPAPPAEEPAPEPAPAPAAASAPEPEAEPKPEPKPAPARVEKPAPKPAPEPTPQPEPEPGPAPTAAAGATSAPEPKPEPAPKPAPEPAPAPAASGGTTVSMVGDATRVLLQSQARVYQLGEVPPGTYSISAWFSGDDPIPAGTITIAEGENVTLRCSSLMLRCSKE